MRIRGRDKLQQQYNTYKQAGRILELPSQYKGRWHEVFGNHNPIHIEIGTGRGRFISTLAHQNPEINYVGIELEHELLGRVANKAAELEVGKNLIVTFEDQGSIELKGVRPGEFNEDFIVALPEETMV